MIFESGKDIEYDIKNKISYYLKNNEDVNLKSLSSILSVYFQELKNIGEVNKFNITMSDEDTFFNVFFMKDNIDFHFNISLVVEMRNIKIEKIKSNKIINFEII